MSRSVRVAKDFINQVKVAVQRQGYPRQRDLAEELNLCLATVSNFLKLFKKGDRLFHHTERAAVG